MTPVFTAIGTSTAKGQNAQRTVTVSLWSDGKFVKNSIVVKRSPSDKALEAEVAFWGAKFGLQVGKEVVQDAPAVARESKKDRKARLAAEAALLAAPSNGEVIEGDAAAIQ